MSERLDGQRPGQRPAQERSPPGPPDRQEGEAGLHDGRRKMVAWLAFPLASPRALAAGLAGGNRTRTGVSPAHFKGAASAISPLPDAVERRASGNTWPAAL